MNKLCPTRLLSLSQRERIEVRDCSGRVVRGLTKWPGERYRVLPGPDDSKSERRRSLVWLGIPLAVGRVLPGPCSHGLNRPIRWQASGPGNRNPGCTDRSGVVAGIYRLRSFDFEDVARECARNRSPSYGENGRESLGDYLSTRHFLREAKSTAPSPQSSPRKRGEADRSISEVPLLEDLRTSQGIIRRKYQRRRASAEDVASVDQLISERASE
jgi:hypothetical protein